MNSQRSFCTDKNASAAITTTILAIPVVFAMQCAHNSDNTNVTVPAWFGSVRLMLPNMCLHTFLVGQYKNAVLLQY